MPQKVLRSQLGFFPSQDPIDALAGVSPELQEDVRCRRTQTQLVLRHLSLRQTQDAAELGLSQVEAAYLPDSATDSFQVGTDKNSLASGSHIRCIIHSLNVGVRDRKTAAVVKCRAVGGQEQCRVRFASVARGLTN